MLHHVKEPFDQLRAVRWRLSAGVAQDRAAIRVALLTLDNRYLPPLLITSILLGAHLSYGILEAWYSDGAGDWDRDRRRTA